MKKTGIVFLMIFSLLFPHGIAFSIDKKMDETNKAHLLQDILLLNKQISKMNYINKKSRTILKKNKNK